MSIIGGKRILTKCQPKGYYIRWYANGWHHYFFKSTNEDFTTDGENYKSNGSNSIMLGDNNLNRNKMLGIRSILDAKYIYLYSLDGWNPCTIDSQTWNLGRNDKDGAFVSFMINTFAKSGSCSPVYEVEEPESYRRITYTGDYRITYEDNNRITA